MTPLETTAVLLTLAVGPALFWLLYFYSKDKYEPEPRSWILKIFLLGALITIPIGIGNDIAGIFLSGVVATVVIAPVIEECGKFFIVKRYVYKTRELNEPVDGIIYAVAAALGFATIENILYIFSVPVTELSTLFWVIVLRAVLSVPGHALYSSMWGYSLGIAKFGNPNDAPKIIIAGLAAAIVFHALFNFLLCMELAGFALLVLIVVPLCWRLVHRNIKDALMKSGFR